MEKASPVTPAMSKSDAVTYVSSIASEKVICIASIYPSPSKSFVSLVVIVGAALSNVTVVEAEVPASFPSCGVTFIQYVPSALATSVFELQSNSTVFDPEDVVIHPELEPT